MKSIVDKSTNKRILEHEGSSIGKFKKIKKQNRLLLGKRKKIIVRKIVDGKVRQFTSLKSLKDMQEMKTITIYEYFDNGSKIRKSRNEGKTWNWKITLVIAR